MDGVGGSSLTFITMYKLYMVMVMLKNNHFILCVYIRDVRKYNNIS